MSSPERLLQHENLASSMRTQLNLHQPPPEQAQVLAHGIRLASHASESLDAATHSNVFQPLPLRRPQIWPHTTPAPISNTLPIAPPPECQRDRPWKQLPLPVPQHGTQSSGSVAKHKQGATSNSPESLWTQMNSSVASEASLDDESPSLPPIINIFYSMAHDSTEQTVDPLAPPIKKRRRSGPEVGRRRWTDEETHSLLKGVEKHGVGNWQAILRDEEFVFDNRTSSSLKDRYRTCRREDPRLPKIRTRSKPIMPPPQDTEVPLASSNTEASDGSEAHSDKDETEEPRRSNRRKRRPFSASDDREILAGLQRYGPAWAMILSHSSLSDRQPTDLRDRVRNRFPELYKRLEKRRL